jgi:Helix-turn-helix domain
MDYESIAGQSNRLYTVIKTHQIRLNPRPEQEVYFRKAADTARFVYNWGLAEWKRHKAENPGEEHGAMALKKDFNALKAEQFPWVYDVAKDPAPEGLGRCAVEPSAGAIVGGRVLR